MQELIVLEDVNALAIFKDGGAEAILSRIEEQVRAEVPDVDTAKGRKAIASLARKVSSSKVLLDDAGKALVSDAKAQIKLVDVERSLIRTRLDDLRDATRQPLTDWEAAEKAAEDAERARIEKQLDHEDAVIMDAEFDRLREQVEELKSREAAVAEHENRIAVEKADAERDEKIKQDGLDKQAEIKAAAEQATADAEAKTLREQTESDNAERKRKNDERHVNRVNQAAFDAIRSLNNISDDDARAVVKAVIDGLVPHITINY